MRSYHVVVIGTSAGGLDALRTLVAGLPADFPAPICVVMHTAPQSPGVLDEILSRSGPLPAHAAHNLQRLRPGQIYVAPPDVHLVIEPERLRVTKGPRENRFRPAIDPLFRSAAQVYGPRAIGVVLTGNLGDGTAGLWTIKQLGGVAIVQDPLDALFPSMPRNALEHVKIDHVVPLRDIAPLLVRLTAADREGAAAAVPKLVEVEVDIAKERDPLQAGIETIGEPSSYACPECHGVLLRIEDGGLLRFRCHTGHAYSAESLVAEINDGIEDSLWNAIRALQEGGMLMQRLADHVSGHNREEADRMRARGGESLRQADSIRALVSNHEPATLDTKP